MQYTVNPPIFLMIYAYYRFFWSFASFPYLYIIIMMLGKKKKNLL